MAEKIGTFKIYVANVPQGATKEEIKQIFEEFGTVVECDLLGKTAFVHMEDDIEGKHAIGQLQGRTLNGQVLTIQESNNPGFARVPAVKLLVKNVSLSVDARGLRNLFKKFGCVLEVVLEEGEGHVSLEAVGDIGSAIKEMNGHMINEQAMSVEPGPVVTPPQEGTPYSRRKFSSPNQNRGRKDWNNSWSSPNESVPIYHLDDTYDTNDTYDESYDETYEDNNFEYDYGGRGCGPNPFEFPHASPFQNDPYSSHEICNEPPERILRDPKAHHPGGFNNRPRPQFPGPRLWGQPPRGMFPRGPPPPHNKLMPGGPVRGMRPMGMRSGFPPHHIRQHHPQHFNNEGRVPRDAFAAPQQAEYNNEYSRQEEVFYEDEPLAAPPTRFNLSGANAIPIGGGGSGPELVSRTPMRGRGTGRMGRGGGRGRGQGRYQKFTAVTEEVAPGQKYPVPPMLNPGFRAPMKYRKEEVKKKIKRKKQPLVPAELPDYTIPVPDLPKTQIPRGAVFKPFPPPSAEMSQHSDSLMTSSSFGYSPQQTGRSQVDFTLDEIV